MALWLLALFSAPRAITVRTRASLSERVWNIQLSLVCIEAFFYINILYLPFLSSKKMCFNRTGFSHCCCSEEKRLDEPVILWRLNIMSSLYRKCK